MEMRTSEDMPELSICGTPLRSITTLRPPPCTTDCSAALSWSLGSPMVKRPRTLSRWIPSASFTEISMGKCSGISQAAKAPPSIVLSNRLDHLLDGGRSALYDPRSFFARPHRKLEYCG